MRLATLDDGSRDGRLIVVEETHRRAAPARSCRTLQAALDDWAAMAPALAAETRALAGGDRNDAFPFEPARCLAPLPRAYQWVDGSAYVNHVALVREARGAELPASFWTDPLMYQGGSDSFLAPTRPIRLADEAWGIDFEAEIAVVTGDVPMGADRATALAAVRLLMLVNDVSLRNLVPGELGKGFGFFHAKPSSAFAPLAVGPSTLGAAWIDGRLAGTLAVDLNDEPFGRTDPAVDMTFDFADLIVHAAHSRPLGAGTIVGSGTVSNRDGGGPGRTIADGGKGYSCIAEQRMVETIIDGAPRTPFLRFGDRVRIELFNAAGRSVFGAIEQTLEPYP